MHNETDRFLLSVRVDVKSRRAFATSFASAENVEANAHLERVKVQGDVSVRKIYIYTHIYMCV